MVNQPGHRIPQFGLVCVKASEYFASVRNGSVPCYEIVDSSAEPWKEITSIRKLNGYWRAYYPNGRWSHIDSLADMRVYIPESMV